MDMDRNLPENDGMGKYAVINLRKLRELCPGDTFSEFSPGVTDALRVLEEVGALEWGAVGTPSEFFLIKLRDRHSLPALQAYGDSIRMKDPDFSDAVYEMTMRSGPHSPFCKEPD